MQPTIEQGPSPTDHDRLDDAFFTLDEAGIVARQDFTCCASCGHHEIWEEIGAEPARGYVFFHWQDTETAARGDGLYLAYGSTSEGDEASVAVGREIVAAQGLITVEDARNGLLKATVEGATVTVTVKPVTKKTVELRVKARDHVLVPKVDVAQAVYTKILERLPSR